VNCPALNIFGTFFPSWMLCTLIGIVAAVIVFKLLAALQIDRWVGPRLLVYPSIALAVTATVWLVRYGH
jgi:YtcA family